MRRFQNTGYTEPLIYHEHASVNVTVCAYCFTINTCGTVVVDDNQICLPYILNMCAVKNLLKYMIN